MNAQTVAEGIVSYINRRHGGCDRSDVVEVAMCAADKLYMLAEPGSEGEQFFLDLAHALETALLDGEEASE